MYYIGKLIIKHIVQLTITAKAFRKDWKIHQNILLEIFGQETAEWYQSFSFDAIVDNRSVIEANNMLLKPKIIEDQFYQSIV